MDNLRRRTLVYLEEEDIPSTAQVATSGNTVYGNVLYYPLYGETLSNTTTNNYLVLFGKNSTSSLIEYGGLSWTGSGLSLYKYTTSVDWWNNVKVMTEDRIYKPLTSGDTYYNGLPLIPAYMYKDNRNYYLSVIRPQGYIKLKFNSPVCICEIAKNSSGKYVIKKPGTILPGLEHPFYLDNE